MAPSPEGGGKFINYFIELYRNGGAERDRTADLVIANDALSQLSYSPAPMERLLADHDSLG
jgi:hypothetical protein